MEKEGRNLGNQEVKGGKDRVSEREGSWEEDEDEGKKTSAGKVMKSDTRENRTESKGMYG